MATSTYNPEPEESLEAALVSLIAADATIPVEGVLAPATSGTVKRLSSDSFISVIVDQSSQDLDRRIAGTPHTYSATIAVHFAQCDDASGTSFRDECRRVRSSLVSLTGDGCSAITTATESAFMCDGFILNTTSTSYEGGDSPVMIKTYNATVKGRVDTTPPTTQSAEEAEQ